MKQWWKKPLIQVYAVGVAIWMLWATFLFLKGIWYSVQGKAGEITISPSQMEYIALTEQKPTDEIPQTDWLVSTDSDPQIRWKCEGRYLEKISLQMDTLWPTGAVVLYYRKANQPDFVPTQMVYATQKAQGQYVFDLAGITVEEIRIDPASQGGVILKIHQIQTQSKGLSVFLPNWQQLALLLLLPPVGLAVYRIVLPIIKRKS